MQTRVFHVIKKLRMADERWGLVYSVPMENIANRARAARMGCTRGISDINCDLPSASGEFGYLRIELKTSMGSQSPDQKAYEHLVTAYGRALYVVCRSENEVFVVLANYLALGRGFVEHCTDLLPRNALKNAFFCP